MLRMHGISPPSSLCAPNVWCLLTVWLYYLSAYWYQKHRKKERKSFDPCCLWCISVTIYKLKYAVAFITHLYLGRLGLKDIPFNLQLWNSFKKYIFYVWVCILSLMYPNLTLEHMLNMCTLQAEYNGGLDTSFHTYQSTCLFVCNIFHLLKSFSSD